MNSPRKSSVQEVPSVFFTPFAVPFAGDQLAGQELQKNAITAPCGTVRPFRSFRFDTMAFHASFERRSHVPTPVSETKAAYEYESVRSVTKNATAERTDFPYLAKIFPMLLYE